MAAALTVVVVLTALVAPSLLPVALMLGFVVALAAGAAGRAHSATPRTIRRMPTAYEQHRRWRLGFGLAFGFHGIFPFVYVTRRIR